MAGHIPTALSCDWCTPDWVIAAVHDCFQGPPALDPCSNPYSRVKAKVEYTLERGNDGLLDPWDAETVYCNPPFGKGWWKPSAHTQVCTMTLNDQCCLCGAQGRRDYIWPSDRQALQAQVKAGTMTKREMQDFLRPYTMADLGTWIKRCSDEGYHRDVIGLIPAYPGTRAWHRDVWPTARAIFWPKGRLHFRLVYGQPDGSTVEKNGPAPMDCALPYWGSRERLEAFQHAFAGRGVVQVLR